MTIDDNITDEKQRQHDINREAERNISIIIWKN